VNSSPLCHQHSLADGGRYGAQLCFGWCCVGPVDLGRAAVLMVPALPAFVVLGLLFLWLGHRSSASPEADYLTGSRPSRLRRRRNRGGLS
jgi:hypothetical protein